MNTATALTTAAVAYVALLALEEELSETQSDSDYSDYDESSDEDLPAVTSSRVVSSIQDEKRKTSRKRVALSINGSTSKKGTKLFKKPQDLITLASIHEKGFITSFELLHSRDEASIIQSTRMSPASFDVLLMLLGDSLGKYSFRKPIPPAERLFVTLVFLAHGMPLHEVGTMFNIGSETVRGITAETVDAMLDLLHQTYLPSPDNVNWSQIVEDYQQIHNIPNCLGAIDGKHISIKCCVNKGTPRSKQHQKNVVMIATCDAHCIFTTLDLGTYGLKDCATVFPDSKFGSQLLNNELTIPLPKPLTVPSASPILPHYFIGDDRFPLHVNLMTPYASCNQDTIIVNACFSRAYNTIENAMGVLTARWKILNSRMHMTREKAEKMVTACVLLHNFLKKSNCPSYCPDDYEDAPNGTRLGNWRQERLPEVSHITKIVGVKSHVPLELAEHNRDSLKMFLSQAQMWSW